MEKHSLVCEEFPVECPNQCVVSTSKEAEKPLLADIPVPLHEVQEIQSCKMKRKELQAHLRDDCPLERVECEFANAGCPVKLLRREMQSHLQDAMLEHNILLKDVLDSSLKRIAHLSRIVQLGRGSASTTIATSSPSSDQYKCNVLPIVFTITDITTLKEQKQVWFSPSFYSFLGGHKLQLKVYPNGLKMGKDSHLSVYAYIMQGENDDSLQWPLSADIEIELLKFDSDEGHHSQVLYLPGDGFCHQVTDRVRSAWAHGIEQFASHSFIFHHSSEYVSDGCLRIRVKKMSTYSTPNACKVPSWQSTSLPMQSLCEFTLPCFSRCKASNLPFHSPPFYTHPEGYRMFLRVHANGKRHGFETSVSIGAQLMKGKFDSSLDWPFKNDIAYELVNWREDSNHHHGAISFGFFDARVCTKVVADIAQYGYLEDHFVPHSALAYNSATNTQYLQDDCLRLRVKEVAVYSAPSIPQVLSWQDPNLPSQSVFEFTLNEFSKRRLFNNEYFSTPFYTHPQGYKMQAEVFANGERQSSGVNSHISVYVTLLNGEHDDTLQWPLSLDVAVQLLNYRRNGDHVRRVIRFHQVEKCSQNMVGPFGPRSGYTMFIPHTSLAYNPFTDVEYLRDDCLRFSVDVSNLSV